jgi:hypothetical protein
MKNSITTVIPDFYEWPHRWKALPEDVEYGKNVLPIFEAFLEYLIQSGLTKKTIQRHADNLWLLGGEVIREIDMNSEKRDKKPIELISKKIGPDGGPYCRHLESEAEMKSFDTTCRKLYRFLQNTDFTDLD